METNSHLPLAVSHGQLPTYVRQIRDTAISVKPRNEADEALLRTMGFESAPEDELRADLILQISTDEQRAELFKAFQKLGIAFSTGRGWSPEAEIVRLTEQGMLTYPFKIVVWTGGGEWYLYEESGVRPIDVLASGKVKR
jgi:hypothetical protein